MILYYIVTVYIQYIYIYREREREGEINTRKKIYTYIHIYIYKSFENCETQTLAITKPQCYWAFKSRKKGHWIQFHLCFAGLTQLSWFAEIGNVMCMCSADVGLLVGMKVGWHGHCVPTQTSLSCYSHPHERFNPHYSMTQWEWVCKHCS